MASTDELTVAALIHNSLLKVDASLAKVFQTKTKSPALPKGSPTLLEIFQQWQKTTPKKLLIKANGKKSDSSSDDSSEDEKPAQKTKAAPAPAKVVPTKKAESSSSDDSSDEEEAKKPVAKKVVAAAPAKKAPVVAKKAESSSEDSSDEEEEKKPVAPAKKAVAAPAKKAAVVAKKADSSSSEDSSDEEEEKKPAAKKVVAAAPAAKKAESSSSEDSSDEEEAKKPAATPAKKAPVAKKAESSSEDSSDEEEAKKPAATPAKKAPVAKKAESSSSEDSSDEEEKKPAAVPAKKKDSSSDSSDSEDEDVTKPPQKAKAAAPAAKKADSSSSEDSSDEEEKPAKKPVAKTNNVAAKKEESSEDSSDDSDEEEKPKAKTPVKAAVAKKTEESSSSDDDDDEDEEPAKPKPAEKRKREEDADEIAAEATPNKVAKNNYDNFVKGGFNGDKSTPKNSPFRRVRDEEIEPIKAELCNNSFEAKRGARGSWGERANLDLKHTRGKSFRHEKTKKKRGSYKGGQIDSMQSHSTTIFLGIIIIIFVLTQTTVGSKKCAGNGLDLKYVWGDAMTDSPDCIGPNNMQYPSAAITRSFKNLWGGNSRTARSHNNQRINDPESTRKTLLHNYQISKGEVTISNTRNSRSYSSKETCGSPARLCKTRYNTTAPMYGVSLTSGQPVTIVQKFPDLLQQVVFEVCESKSCDVIRGECTQTYVPYLFLVIPLGPVTLTGQDYVLVESGCVCKPKNSSPSSNNSPETPLVPNLS
ncbi:hypothetical protein HCN44_010789 [Aphidius gifuensis]|uniref:Srp40 C-terminal domain-containing protein n=1 Tax=Aphidius gifuensis TaxID=684658 RepID=A0A834XT41_APHGI|nr:hypothetical protein HCN44_010789 [Aphidius gifuensis]